MNLKMSMIYVPFNSLLNETQATMVEQKLSSLLHEMLVINCYNVDYI